MADVFISHIESEKALAEAVERLLRIALQPNFGERFASPNCTIFRSSSTHSLKGGERFEDKIASQIHSCKAFVMMCSEESFKSHWVHAEAGAAWVLGKRVIPVCYCGKSKGALPRPYSSFHAVNLDEAYHLVLAVNDALDLHTLPVVGPSRKETRKTGPKVVSLKLNDPIPHYYRLYEILDALENPEFIL